MDLTTIKLTADSLLHLPKQFYPWFDVCHILLCVLTVRKECQLKFAREHPAATLLSCIVSSFAGSLLANPLMGKFKALLVYILYWKMMCFK